ncbi:hypothetical protein PROFUN_03975 [Planoprotostelium fungivorum]|uniref:Coatomer subunit beta n=1 Tax=Planoprotostelium fungivorum TaxID=1890364 RepID=A0A2P6NW13_9EUKA|nr:hypothetical protein PROFUN_03975 [Planoprotostelium fungivorum]
MGDKTCTVLISYEQNEPPQISELKRTLETATLPEKIEAMKRVILLLIAGENLSQLLMTIIRFVMPIDDHQLKKLLLLYLEIVDKTSADGKLLSEMILVCNAIRNDLIHPNEYVRGSTLRFLSKLKEPEILEPLLPSVRTNLESKHAYVRRNAVLALYNVYKNFDYLCPDAPELVYSFLLNEGDASCKRNAFIMLFNCAQEKAVEYLSETLDQVSGMGEIIQFIVVELIRKVCRNTPTERPKYIKCVFTLLSSTSSAVQYEAAGTLLALSSAPTAVKAATSTYIDLLVKEQESDNNVKMIVLDRLLTIKQRHPKIMEELLMDILRALASPNMDIRKKTVDIALDLITVKNIEEVVQVFKKEILKTQNKEFEHAEQYRQLLIQTIHTCAVKFPDVAANVATVLMEFLGDPQGGSANDVIIFVREVIERYPELRSQLVGKLIEFFPTIRASKVFRTALWILSEYSSTSDEIDRVFTAIKEGYGELPLFTEEETDEENKEETKEKKPVAQAPAPRARAKVLADGTYATQSALTETAAPAAAASVTSGPGLRGVLLGGDFFLAGVLSISLTKLALKLEDLNTEAKTLNLYVSEILLLMVSVLRYGKSSQTPSPIDPDSEERIISAINILTEPDSDIKRALIVQCKEAYGHQLISKPTQPVQNTNRSKEVSVQVDDVIKIRQLRTKKTYGLEDLDEMDDSDLIKATGVEENADGHSYKLNKVNQLTGFSDPIYAEAVVIVHQYDIVLDVTVINQTPKTLQNVALELATLGDLKLVERPQVYTIAPGDKKQIKANIKVSSTDTGIIFGNIVYDIAGVQSGDKNSVVLNEIHIDIMDYISPAYCHDLKFRSMWAEFEWENKIAVNSNLSSVNDYLKNIMKSTNMGCLTPESALSGDSGFLSANLYAKSVFGEDALANISVERLDDKISGFIRIRSRTQGIALSLGDKITIKQREDNNRSSNSQAQETKAAPQE